MRQAARATPLRKARNDSWGVSWGTYAFHAACMGGHGTHGPSWISTSMVYLRGQGREVRCVRQHTFGVQAGWLIRPLSALLHWQRVQRACRGWSVPHPPLLIRKMMGFVS